MEKGNLVCDGTVTLRADGLIDAVRRAEDLGCAVRAAQWLHSDHYACEVSMTQAAANAVAMAVLRVEAAFSPQARAGEGPEAGERPAASDAGQLGLRRPGLAGLRLQDATVAALAMRAVERLSDGCELPEDARESLLDEGGLVLVASDACHRAAAREGRWDLIERLQAFFESLARTVDGGPAAQLARSVLASIAERRIDVGDEGTRNGSLGTIEQAKEGAAWIGRCLLEVAALAHWTESDSDPFEGAASWAGLEIAAVLVRECGASAAREFIMCMEQQAPQPSEKAA